jgi:FMN phosphatase YigB (HAD superfamily)
MKAAIFDMDGTLCDISPLRYLVNPSHPHFPGKKDWEGFHGGAINCEPIPRALEEYHRAVDRGLKVLIVTARMRMWALPTLLWLKEHHIAHDELYMRPMFDYRKDYVVKREILEQILDDGYHPVLAVDDNPSVIRLWEEHEIPTVVIPGWEGA